MAEICEKTYDENGNSIGGSPVDSSTENNSCIDQPGNGASGGATSCPDTGADKTCKPWQFTMSKDNCLIDQYVNEALSIAGADINVFKLLGIHEQTKLVDLIDNGEAISGGDKSGFPKEQAFTTYVTEWHSAQTGTAVLTSAYIGYDFGVIKLENNRRRYGIDTSIKHNIATIKLKQGNNSQNRATKVRVERSPDGIKWYGSAILTVPDDNCLNTFYFRNTSPMRYWRLRPIEFNGSAGDYWTVQAIELSDYDSTSIEDIQDKIWNENRDRDFASESVRIKGSYPLIEVDTEMSRAGIELPGQTFTFSINFTASVSVLGRPIVIGDIFELPSETQYNSNLESIKKYLEVTDVTWSAEGYTPGWVPTLQRVSTRPMLATQETADIVGGLEGYEDDTGFLQSFDETHGIDDGSNPNFQDYSDISQTIEQTASNADRLPERGTDPTDITQFTDEQLEAAEEQQEGSRNALKGIGLRPKDLYVEDAMPPNGLPFTEGDSFPTSPSNGAYHRLTYTGYDETIPPRLFRYSTAKGRWLYMETDRRLQYAETKPVLQEYLGSSTRKPSDEVGK